jgi:hypothetical protein
MKEKTQNTFKTHLYADILLLFNLLHTPLRDII